MIKIYQDNEGYEVFTAGDKDSKDRIVVLKDGKRLDAEAISVIRTEGSQYLSMAFIGDSGELYHSISNARELDLREFIIPLVEGQL